LFCDTTMKATIFSVFISAILFSCAPKITSTINNPQPLEASDLVVVLKPEDMTPNNAIEIGTIKSGDNGFSTNCNYDEVIGTLKEKARKSGANILKITEHKLPNGHTTCDRIKAKLYRTTNAKQYEKEIEWTADRKLDWSDFKGEVPLNEINTRTLATTYAQIAFRTNYVSLFTKGKTFVKASFRCDSSWMKTVAPNNKNILLHEQAHFDLTELYARKLRQEFSKMKISVFNMPKVNKMFTENYMDYYHREHLFDYETEHGLDTLKEKLWEETIKNELNQLAAFATKS
jgi:hypothetical protein